ncbi:FISUMP domain-containing protein [Bacteroidota bacterium]
MKTSIFTILLIALVSVNLMFCSNDSSAEPDVIGIPDSTTVSDFEGNIYHTIRIGNQLWMSENLKTINTSTGDQLNGVYAYNDNEDNVEEYGRLYTWEAALNSCPEGWHLPTNAEWNELISTLGSNAPNKLLEGGTSGFNAKMGGRLSGDSFGYIGELGAYWTSTSSDTDHATQKLIVLNESEVITDNTLITGALSVRYIKSAETGIFNHTEKNSAASIETPFKLSQNFPNPFREYTFFSFKIVEAGIISLKVYDVFGKEVVSIINNEFYHPRKYTIMFDNQTNALKEGVYFLSLQGENIQKTRKMIIN